MLPSKNLEAMHLSWQNCHNKVWFGYSCTSSHEIIFDVGIILLVVKLGYESNATQEELRHGFMYAFSLLRYHMQTSIKSSL